MQLSIKLLDGQLIEKTIDSNICVIGRSNSCDVVIQQDGMSRQHCQIELANGDVFVTDLGSTNGVLIDGVKIVPHKRTPYALYQTLAFGTIQSMQIKIDELRGSLKVKPLSNRETAEQNAAANLTKTKALKDLPGPEVKTASSEASSGIPNKLMAFLILIVFAGIYWWYNQ